VAELCTTTLAVGTIAPELSTTVPATAPSTAVCPLAIAPAMSNGTNKKLTNVTLTKTLEAKLFFMRLISLILAEVGSAGQEKLRQLD
jgi:hypothetical protein